MSEAVYQILGYSGSALVLGAYIAVSHWHSSVKKPVYLWHVGAVPSVIVNIVWMAVAIFALLRVSNALTAKKRRQRKKPLALLTKRV